jgi:GAF domain-containing protein
MATTDRPVANSAWRRQRETDPAPWLRWLTIALWLALVVAALLLNTSQPPTDWLGIALFVVLHIISGSASVRVPPGLYIGLLNASVIGAGLVFGFRVAMAIPLFVLAIMLPIMAASQRLPRFRHYPRVHLVENLRQSTANALSALVAGWLYESLGGHIGFRIFDQSLVLLLALYVVMFLAVKIAVLSLDMAARGIAPVPFWLSNWQPILLSELLAPLFIGPMLATLHELTVFERLLGLIPYAMGSGVLYSLNRAQFDLADRAADLRTLNRLGQALNARLEMGDLLATLHRELSHLLDTSGIYVALVDQQANLLSFVMYYAEGVASPPHARSFQNGLTEYIIRTRQPLLLASDVQAQAIQLGIQPHGSRARSYLGVPVFAGEQVVGVMALRHYHQEFAYDENDLRLMETAAAAAGIALQNASLYEQSRRRASELSTLNRISTLVSASLDRAVVLETICQAVVEVMGCQKAAVFLLDDEGLMHLAHSVGLSQEYIERSARIDPHREKRAMALEEARTLAFEDVLNVAELAGSLDLIHAGNIRGVLDVPLRVGDRSIGTLSAYYDQPHHFEGREIELMETLAGQVAVAVENARLFDTTNARRHELQTLYETGRIVNASLALPTVLRAVTISMMQVLEIDVSATLLADISQQQLVAEFCIDNSGSALSERTVKVSPLAVADVPGLAERAREQAVLSLERQEGTAHTVLLDALGLASALGLPMVVHGDLVGLIVVGHRDEAVHLEPDQLRLARALTIQAALAIQNARLYNRTDAELSRRLVEIAALEALSQRMARRLDLQTVIEQVVTAAKAATGADLCEVALLDEHTGTLNVIARQGLDTDRAENKTWDASQGLTGRALRTGAAVRTGNVHEEPDYLAGRPGIQSELAVPIALDDQRLGVINLESTSPDAFDADQERFITALAENAAIAIQNAQLFETLQKRAEEFRTLRAVAVDLLSASDLKHTLGVIAREALTHTGAQDIHIYLYDDETDQLTFGTSLWASGKAGEELSSPRPDGLTATVARSGERLVVGDLNTHPLFADMAEQPDWVSLQAIVGMPLKHADQVIGVFNIAFEERGQLDDETLHFLDLLAAQAAVAISNTRLAQQTRITRDRLQAILDSIHDGILLFDMDGRLAMANPRVEKLLDLPISDYVGQRFVSILRRLTRDEAGMTPFKVNEAIEIARKAQADPTVTTRRTYRLYRPGLRVINEMSIPVISQEGALMGRLFILRDETQEYEMEMYRQEMSHMIVHDLRSPLSGVITGLYMALEDIELLPHDEVRESLEATATVALGGAESLLQLVEQILEVSRLEAGEMPLLPRLVRVTDIAEQSVHLLSGMIADANIDVTIHAPPDLAPIRVDTDKIQRVIINLLDNALRYTPEGGQVRIDILPGDRFQTVVVTDTGEGIPPEARERVFERFYQGDISRRKRGTKGSGLGLTFCRLAVEAHGGRIWVSSGQEGGAAFHFTLPVSEA